MAIKQLTPYLNFNGDASQAFELYQSALGAKIENVMKFGDAPGGGRPEDKNRVMHAVIHIGNFVVMASDGMPGRPVPPGGNAHICLDFDDPEDLKKKFDALAQGGTITMPLQDTFCGAKFGMLTDRFGILWMFNCEMRKG